MHQLLSHHSFTISYHLPFYLQPAHNVTFLEEGSYLSIDPFLRSRKKSFTIGLAFRVVPVTKNGLIFLEAHSEGVSILGSA